MQAVCVLQLAQPMGCVRFVSLFAPAGLSDGLLKGQVISAMSMPAHP